MAQLAGTRSLEPLPRGAAGRDRRARAGARCLAGYRPGQVWDSHVHLVGTGDSASGIVRHPAHEQPARPGPVRAPAVLHERRLRACRAGGAVDNAYVARMLHPRRRLRPGCACCCSPSSAARRAGPGADPDKTGFYVPNPYARERGARASRVRVGGVDPSLSRRRGRRARARAAEGARAVKWLPAAMGIDPASPRCDRFTRRRRSLDLPLISHAGEERAVIGAEAQRLRQPAAPARRARCGRARRRRALRSLGEDRDLDRGANGPPLTSFALFAR